MYSLPISNSNNVLNRIHTWFQYKTGQQDGFKRLNYFQPIQYVQPLAAVYTPAEQTSVDTVEQLNYEPLTAVEEHRWKQLDRKAKQENLSGYDVAEYEILLEIKLYHRIKAESPQFSHRQVVEIVKQTL